jgi:hypothetical protein
MGSGVADAITALEDAPDFAAALVGAFELLPNISATPVFCIVEHAESPAVTAIIALKLMPCAIIDFRFADTVSSCHAWARTHCRLSRIVPK